MLLQQQRPCLHRSGGQNAWSTPSRCNAVRPPIGAPVGLSNSVHISSTLKQKPRLTYAGSSTGRSCVARLDVQRGTGCHRLAAKNVPTDTRRRWHES